MIYGNSTTYHQLKSLIQKLLHDEQQTVYPFILIAGPAHIGKSHMVHELLADADLNPYDIALVQDLSDDWASLKESNDLAGTFHSIQIEVESKRQDIRMEDGSTVHNWGIRELQEWLVRSPLGRDKVVLIEAIERATGGASNALLKTLEEPLPHRLMIATTHQISQLPATIASRAMIFSADVLSRDEMQAWMQSYLPHHTHYEDLMLLASGRPGLIVHYHTQGILDDIVASWKSVQGQLLNSGMIATLYQQMITINKSGYLNMILDALIGLAHETQQQKLYDATFELIRMQDSNINIDNLLFEWCLRVKT